MFPFEDGGRGRVAGLAALERLQEAVDVGGLEWERGEDGETVLRDRGKKRAKDKDAKDKKKKAKKTKVVEF